MRQIFIMAIVIFGLLIYKIHYQRLGKKVTINRVAQYPVDSIFLHRWSPRAMSGEAIAQEELYSLFEAARWAPSSFNEQPWRFIYAVKGTPEWDVLFNLLVPFNQNWVSQASVLVIVVSKNTFTHNNEVNIVHSLDTGAALENLALEGSLRNIVVHAMAGFNYDEARVQLGIPLDYTIEAMVALGKPGALDVLPAELQEKEVPSTRNQIDAFVYQGVFGKPI